MLPQVLTEFENAVGARVGLDQTVGPKVLVYPQGVERSGVETGQEHIDHNHQVQLAFFRRCDKSCSSSETCQPWCRSWCRTVRCSP